jgi:hypothetical protein
MSQESGFYILVSTDFIVSLDLDLLFFCLASRYLHFQLLIVAFFKNLAISG